MLDQHYSACGSRTKYAATSHTYHQMIMQGLRSKMLLSQSTFMFGSVFTFSLQHLTVYKQKNIFE
jgi:hypothetical protein